MALANWTKNQLHAWRWPDKLTVSQWAGKHRILPSFPEVSSEPGPWRNSRTPYLCAPMDAAGIDGIDMIVGLKGHQIGWSEGTRNVLGYWIDCDPGPSMLIGPNEKSAQEFLHERIRPLIEHTPQIQRHLVGAWNARKNSVTVGMTIYAAWAGSGQSLKSRPIRYEIFEEPDEYPAVSGKGLSKVGDPISKALKRLTTYANKGRAKAIIGGTPTTRANFTWQYWISCGERYYFWVPCPHCGRFQRLVWQQVKWSPRHDGEPRERHSLRIKDQEEAWYECQHCHQSIREHSKHEMLNAAMSIGWLGWLGEDQFVDDTGNVRGPLRKSSRIGFFIPCLYSPWKTWAQMAGEWIEAQGDREKLSEFITQNLAEPFEEQLGAKTTMDFFSDRAIGSPAPLIVPPWTTHMIATADTQGDTEQSGWFPFVVRAWGYGMRSQQVDIGIARTKRELVDRTLNQQFTIAGREKENIGVSPEILLVDSGGRRWNEVYQLAQSDPRIKPSKGSSYRRAFMVSERMQKEHGVVLWEIDTDLAKDQLYVLIHDPDVTRWMQCSLGANDDYCQQMAAESKIWDPASKKEMWLCPNGRANHYWDCEAMQCAVAWKLGCGVSPPVEASPAQIDSGEEDEKKRPWLRTPQDWKLK